MNHEIKHSNLFHVVSRSLGFAISTGYVPGFSRALAFGANYSVSPETTPEDCWEGGGEYIYDADGVAPITSIASDSSSDTVNILIRGLDVDGNSVSQIKTLTGTDRAELNTPLWRVLSMENIGSINLVGNVFCYIGDGVVPSAGDSEIRAIITPGNNKTLMAQITIPNGHVGYILQGKAGIQWNNTSPVSTGEYIRGKYMVRPYGRVFRNERDISLVTSGNSIYYESGETFTPIPAMSDVKISIDEASSSLGVWGMFDVIYVEQEKFPENLLVSIGQSGY